MGTDSSRRFSFFCDLETSGSCPIKNGVISASILVTDSKLNVIDVFSSKVRPPNLNPDTWSLEAEGIHGQSIGDVKNYISNDQFCYNLLCFLSKYKRPDDFPQPFIFHASRRGWKMPYGWKIWPYFDYHFLEWCFRKAKFENGQEMVWSFYKLFSPNKLFSTVEMGRAAGYKKNNLKSWAERIGFELKHHDDLSDVYCCLEVFKYLGGFEGENNFRNKL